MAKRSEAQKAARRSPENRAKGEALEAKHKAPGIQATVKNYSFHRPVRKVQVRHYK